VKALHRGAWRRALVAGALAAALVVAHVAPGGAQATVYKVKVGDNYFKPDELTIVGGDTLQFKWIGSAIHDVVAKGKSPKKFKSKRQADGKYKRTLLDPGVYKIVCTLHPGMDMKVTVTAPPPTTSTTPPPPAL